MEHFPEFMKNPVNRIDLSKQNTKDVEGYYYEGADGSQMAYWECHSDQVSQKHTHDFDEYTIVVSGEYVAYFEDTEVILHAGDELYVPKGTLQWGKCKAGTRTIHCFGGKRI